MYSFLMTRFLMTRDINDFVYNQENNMLAIMGTRDMDEKTYFFEKIIFLQEFVENQMETYISQINNAQDLQTQQLEVDNLGKIVRINETQVLVPQIGGSLSDIKSLVLLELKDGKFHFSKYWAYKGKLTKDSILKLDDSVFNQTKNNKSILQKSKTISGDFNEQDQIKHNFLHSESSNSFF